MYCHQMGNNKVHYMYPGIFGKPQINLQILGYFVSTKAAPGINCDNIFRTNKLIKCVKFNHKYSKNPGTGTGTGRDQPDPGTGRDFIFIPVPVPVPAGISLIPARYRPGQYFYPGRSLNAYNFIRDVTNLVMLIEEY